MENKVSRLKIILFPKPIIELKKLSPSSILDISFHKKKNEEKKKFIQGDTYIILFDWQ